MRKIKFRGRRIDTGEFVFGDVVQWGGLDEVNCEWEAQLCATDLRGLRLVHDD